MPAFLVSVVGNVQGVYYRAFTQQEAQQLGINGWVRNMPDGSVQVHIQHADEAVLGELIERLGKGPQGAEVESVAPNSVEEDPQLTGFAIIHYGPRGRAGL